MGGARTLMTTNTAKVLTIPSGPLCMPFQNQRIAKSTIKSEVQATQPMRRCLILISNPSPTLAPENPIKTTVDYQPGANGTSRRLRLPPLNKSHNASPTSPTTIGIIKIHSITAMTRIETPATIAAVRKDISELRFGISIPLY
jgi:hypothetical protein